MILHIVYVASLYDNNEEYLTLLKKYMILKWFFFCNYIDVFYHAIIIYLNKIHT